jgi:phosphoenolpyruvate carboxykinase (ATP)
MYHFLSGYTARVAGTEKGVSEPTATFSFCFGAPFLPCHPSVYGTLLRDYLAKPSSRLLACQHRLDRRHLWGRPPRRIPIQATRKLLTATLDGSLAGASFRQDPYFGISVPHLVEGIEPHLLDPVKTWADKKAFDETAKKLVEMFRKNFVKFEPFVDGAVKAAQPGVAKAA